METKPQTLQNKLKTQEELALVTLNSKSRLRKMIPTWALPLTIAETLLGHQTKLFNQDRIAQTKLITRKKIAQSQSVCNRIVALTRQIYQSWNNPMALVIKPSLQSWTLLTTVIEVTRPILPIIPTPPSSYNLTIQTIQMILTKYFLMMISMEECLLRGHLMWRWSSPHGKKWSQLLNQWNAEIRLSQSKQNTIKLPMLIAWLMEFKVGLNWR